MWKPLRSSACACSFSMVFENRLVKARRVSSQRRRVCSGNPASVWRISQSVIYITHSFTSSVTFLLDVSVRLELGTCLLLARVVSLQYPVGNGQGDTQGVSDISQAQ